MLLCIVSFALLVHHLIFFSNQTRLLLLGCLFLALLELLVGLYWACFEKVFLLKDLCDAVLSDGNRLLGRSD